MVLKLFVDTNIVLDFIQSRPFDREAVQIMFAAIEEERAQAFVSESVVTNALYISRLPQQISRLLKLCQTICISNETIQLALVSNHRDKEDAILYMGALAKGIDFFVTRDKKDYKTLSHPALPVMNASELVKLFDY